MALSNAERQAAWRARRAAGEPVRTYRRPADRRSRPQRWADAVEALRALQAEYEDWLSVLPESQAESRTAEMLRAVVDLDLSELDIDLPLGFGRD